MCRSLEEMRNEYEQKGEAIGISNNMKETTSNLMKNGISPEEIIRMCNYPADLVYEVASSLA